MTIETERLLLREYTPEDFDTLYEIMSDPETMQHYPAPFDETRTRRWIEWNLENYAQYGFGLWAVVLKETGEFIGDCGITIQNIDGEMLPEIGYHIHKKHWRKGFAKEAAGAVRDWVFRNTEYDTVYSYMKYTNIGSWSTALANGMRKVKEYPDPKNTVSYAYAITRGEWEKLKKEPIRENEEKDKEVPVMDKPETRLSVCGTDCRSCGCYGNLCQGCNECGGKVFHSPEGCGIYACVKSRSLKDCGGCPEIPCETWRKTRDPQYTDEEFEKSISDRVSALKNR